MIKAFIGMIVGGILAFAWSFVSWSLLPFHQETLTPFKDAPAVAATLKENAPVAGIYVIPYCDKSTTEEERMNAFKEGPFIFASIRPGTKDDFSMVRLMLRGLLATVVCAIIIGLMLGAAAPRLNFIGRVLFVTLGGLFAGLSAAYPNTIWWEFPSGFVLLTILDLVAAWFLAGLVMAGMINGKS